MTHSLPIPKTDALSRPTGPPIHILPPELLCDIFNHRLPTGDGSGWFQSHYYERLHQLRDVCRRWKEIIDDTPSFWQWIYCDMDEKALNQAIRNSKEHLLVVVCSCSRRDESQACKILSGTDSQSSGSESTIAGVSAHCRRWESLVLEYRSETLMQDYLNLPLPSLRRLSIRRDWRGGAYKEDPDHLIFGGEGPRLTELSLGRYRLPWSKLVLDQLRSFKIEEVADGELGVMITDEELLQLLSRTPLLERFWYSDHKEPSHLATHPPKLPLMIRKMRLENVSTSFVQGLCRSIVPHPSGVEEIRMEIKHPSEDSRLTFLHDIGRILDSLSPPCHTFRLYLHVFQRDAVEEYTLTLDFQPIYITFRYDFQESDAIQALNTIFQICTTEVGWAGRAAIKSVRLFVSGAPESLALNLLQQVNNAFPEIAHFDFSGLSMKITSKVLQQLGTSDSPLMPSMTELEIDTAIREEIDEVACESFLGLLHSRPLIEKWSFGAARCDNDSIYSRLRGAAPSGTLKLHREPCERPYDDGPLYGFFGRLGCCPPAFPEDAPKVDSPSDYRSGDW